MVPVDVDLVLDGQQRRLYVRLLHLEEHNSHSKPASNGSEDNTEHQKQ